MKLLFVVIASVIISAHAAFDFEWIYFKRMYNKSYATKDEDKKRQEIFKNNSRLIKEHNIRYAEREVLFDLAMNQFGDLTQEEFEVKMLPDDKTKKTASPSKSLHCESKKFDAGTNFPGATNFSWVDKHAVTPVKDQGTCGASWAFSAVAAIESHYFIKYKKYMTFSEQNLVDCSKNFSNHGCGAGSTEKAFTFLMDQKGLMSNESYPYAGKIGECSYNATKSVCRVHGCGVLPKENEVQLQIAVRHIGPMSVSMYAASFEFRFYKTGIFYIEECSPEESSHTNHNALAVGYGSEDGIAYWLVKNSWGTSWGEDGFFKIAKNANNHCGIASHVTFPGVYY